MVVDIYNSIQAYRRALKRLQNNAELPINNRKLAVQWIIKNTKKRRVGN